LKTRQVENTKKKDIIREGVPIGVYELDSAALPTDIFLLAG